MTIIILLIVVLSFASGQQVVQYTCVPGSSYYVQCNICQCYNGQILCTSMQCPKGQYSQQQSFQQPAQQMYQPTMQQQSPQQPMQQMYQPMSQQRGQPVIQTNIQPGQPAQNNPPTILQNFVQTRPDTSQQTQQQTPQQTSQQNSQQGLLGNPLSLLQPQQNAAPQGGLLGLSVPIYLG